MVRYFQPHCPSLKDNYATYFLLALGWDAFDENSKIDDTKPKWNCLQAEANDALLLMKTIWENQSIFSAYIILS